MPNEAHGPVANPRCQSCQAEIGPTDRFCNTCGTRVMADAGKPSAALKKKGRRHAAIMFVFGLVIVLFAAVHRDPADIILVVAFGLPLCGAGAITWRQT
jgi:zinc-ribbon domain